MYAESPPPPALASIVKCRWRRVAPSGGEVADVLPDGCMDLIAADDGRLFVAGPDTRRAPAELAPGTRLVGLRFRPGTAPAVLGVPAGELRDARPALADLLGNPGRELAGRAADAESDAARLAVLETGLRRLLSHAAEPDPAVAAAVTRLRASPSAAIAPLAEQVGLSERQLRRRFHAAVGYGPKTLGRVLRLQRLLGLAAGGGPEHGLARLALDAGYADQAHMTAECTRLSGRPPGVLLRDRFVKDGGAGGAED